jgi:hypothetical protein
MSQNCQEEIESRLKSGNAWYHLVQNLLYSILLSKNIKNKISFFSSVGATARCGLWPVEQYLSICPYLSPTLSIFSLPTLEDLFPLLVPILSWVFLFVSSLPVLE